MSLESAFQAWWQASLTLRDRVQHACRCCDDRPGSRVPVRAQSKSRRTPSHVPPGWGTFEESPEDEPDVTPITALEQTLTEFLQATQSLFELASQGLAAIAPDSELDYRKARLALVRAREPMTTLNTRLMAELSGFERQRALDLLARKRRGEWPSWLRILRQYTAEIQEAVHSLDDALWNCWQELADRAGGTQISVRPVSIGQIHQGHSRIKSDPNNAESIIEEETARG